MRVVLRHAQIVRAGDAFQQLSLSSFLILVTRQSGIVIVSGGVFRFIRLVLSVTGPPADMEKPTVSQPSPTAD